MKNLSAFLLLLTLLCASSTTAQAQCMCVQLDGGSEYLTTNYGNYNFTNFSIELWIKVPTYNSNIHYLSMYQNAYLVLGDYGTGSFSTWEDGLNPIDIGPSLMIGSTNVWHHVAFTYDGSNQKLYIDGALNLNVPTTGALTLNSSIFNQGLTLGARYDHSTQFVVGFMDEVRIWNVARSITQIQSAMNMELTGNEQGLVSYWPMNDGPGSPIASDLSTNNNDLTLVNMELATDWVAQCPFLPVAPFTLSYTPNDTICEGDTLSLTVSGRDSVIWLPSAFLNTTTGNTVQYFPSSSGTVTAVGWFNGMPNSDTLVLNVHVNPAYAINYPITLCNGDSIFAGGANQGSPGTYIDNFSSITGCDSVITTTLAINPTYSVMDSLTICNGDSVQLGGAFQSAAGTYPVMLYTLFGCDSLVNTVLNVTMLDTSVNVAGGVLTANASQASYQWFICQGNPIPGATGQSFTPQSNGQFSVQITQNGCTAMSGCTDFSVGVSKALSGMVSVYPNPVRNEVFIVLKHELEVASYLVMDELGRVVLRGVLDSGSLATRVDMRALSSGVYHIQVRAGEDVGVYKVVKE